MVLVTQLQKNNNIEACMNGSATSSQGIIPTVGFRGCSHIKIFAMFAQCLTKSDEMRCELTYTGIFVWATLKLGDINTHAVNDSYRRSGTGTLYIDVCSKKCLGGKWSQKMMTTQSIIGF